ncbi:MAG: DPP IV N-terminal domain-containing protein, partial [Phycisphaerales bacterium]
MTNNIISIKFTWLLLMLGTMNVTGQSIKSGYYIQDINIPELSPRAWSQRGRRVQGYYKARITPHWFNDNTCFWYRNDLKDDTREFILVDAEQGTRRKAFDHEKLAAALSRATDVDHSANQLPFDSIEFLEDAREIRFTVDQTTWICDLMSYTCSRTDEVQPQSSAEPAEQESRSDRRRRPGRRGSQSMDSPDDKWTAFVKDNNVFVRLKDSNEEIQLSTDGDEDSTYGSLSWSPDSRTLVAFRIEPGDNKEVYLIESSPEGGGRAKFSSRSYALPGDKFATYELNLFDIDSRKQSKPDVDKLELDWQRPQLHWKKDQHHFAYEIVDRGHQRFRVVEVDPHTGRARNLIDEKTETFIWTAHTE